jgi:hypothetical protein
MIRQRGLGIFRPLLRLVALGSILVGALGTGFHLVPLLKDLSDEPFSLAALEGAVSLAPPMFAPAAFVGVGALLWLLASPNVMLRLRERPVADPVGSKAPPISAPGTWA